MISKKEWESYSVVEKLEYIYNLGVRSTWNSRSAKACDNEFMKITEWEKKREQ